MTDRTSIETNNLDRYGSAELPWDRARDVLAEPYGATRCRFND